VVVVVDLVQDIQGKKIVAFHSKRKFYSELRLRQAIQRPVANIGIYGGEESAPYLESKLLSEIQMIHEFSVNEYFCAHCYYREFRYIFFLMSQ